MQTKLYLELRDKAHTVPVQASHVLVHVSVVSPHLPKGITVDRFAPWVVAHRGTRRVGFVC